jgi:hypothetical protein
MTQPQLALALPIILQNFSVEYLLDASKNLVGSCRSKRQTYTCGVGMHCLGKYFEMQTRLACNSDIWQYI